MMTDSKVITRKAIDISGRLGSFYDAAYDEVIANQPYQASSVHQSKKPVVCKVFSGVESVDLINYLKEMDIDDALQLSILCGMIKPTGISTLIDYDQPVDKNICFFYYCYRSREEELVEEDIDAVLGSSSIPNRITHMIFRILCGFEILCAVPIADHQSVVDVDNLLRNISNRLQNSTNKFVLTDVEHGQIAQLANGMVYGSEKCIKNINNSLLNVLTSLERWKKQENSHHPLIYTIYPLGYRESNNHLPKVLYVSEQNNPDVAHIRTAILSMNKAVANIKTLFNGIPKELKKAVLNQQRLGYQQQFREFLDTLEKFRKGLKQTLVDVRRNVEQFTQMYVIISDSDYISLKDNFETLYQTVNRWFVTVLIIERLEKNNVQYVSVMEFCRHQNISPTLQHFQNAFQCSLPKEDGLVSMFYSNNQLTEEKSPVYETMYQQFLSKQRLEAHKTTLVYADCTDCQIKLEQPIVNDLVMRKEVISSEIPPSRKTEINVLLLGESGVGKSTFINAFVNYLVFDTLQQAEQSEPIVLIPVSFLTTIGDHFEECIVKFGDVDVNENHQHQGQSVTQHCRSYLFHLDDRFILRLIDSPGMGDTRGLAQDDKNIEHILTYVNNLSHLNAVCFLLKPNASRLNVFFRSCINQLFTYLTPIAYDNVIFCFTNSRATFFAPGDTGPLLRQMLKNEHHNDIPFGKANTFCFNSESFRYLAARKCGVQFDEFQKEEYMKSWTTSVTESVRLLDYIVTRTPYHLQKIQSPRKALLDISMLARPLMEILRLNIYNWILRGSGDQTHQIVLICKSVDMNLCTVCANSELIRMGALFFMRFENVRSASSDVQHHQCILDSTNFLIEYTVKHRYVVESSRRKKELVDLINVLLHKCNRLTRFVQQQRCSTDDDLFGLILERFINEQEHILCCTPGDTTINRKLLTALFTLQNKRREDMTRANESKEISLLNEIHEIIEDLKCYESIKMQIDAIKESRRLKMKTSEKTIETNFSSSSRLFTTLVNSRQ